MAKAKKISESSNDAAGSPPKDELALKEATPKAGRAAGSARKVDGSPASSSARKVRIHEDSPAQSVKTRSAAAAGAGSAGKAGKAAGKQANGETASSPSAATATQGSSSSPAAPVDGAEEGEAKHSPKHKNGKQPEKSALKKDKSPSKKRKAAQADDEEDEDAAAAETSNGVGSISLEDAAVDDDEEVEGEGEELDFLAGFESGSDDDDDEGDDANSSDEENMDEPVSVKELPTPKQGKNGGKQAKGKKEQKSKGVVYLGRIPHGFHEEEMKSYFTQFGEVTRLRLSRNKTTGASKHYAFIEFEHASVAQIVSETMDNYLLHGHILQCRVVPTEQVHPKMWVGANRKYRPVPKGRIERLAHNGPKSAEQQRTIGKRLQKRDEQRREKLKELGIEYDFDGYVKTLPEKQVKDQKEEKKARDAARKLENQVKKEAKEVKEKQTREPRTKRAKKSV